MENNNGKCISTISVLVSCIEYAAGLPKFSEIDWNWRFKPVHGIIGKDPALDICIWSYPLLTLVSISSPRYGNSTRKQQCHFEEFVSNGDFVDHRTRNPFSAMGLDQWQKQLNEDVKGNVHRLTRPHYIH